MSTPTSIQKMLDWQQAQAGQLAYSQSDPNRLSADDAHMGSPTDCSGLVARLMKHFAGVDPGTYTGNECNFGMLITTSKAAARAGQGMRPGDVILFDWDGGNWDHIAMYAGNGRIWNHGGPGRGPNNWSLAQSVDWAQQVMVRRFVQWPTPGPTSTPAVKPGAYPLPGLRRFRRGDSGAGVAAIQARLKALGYFAGNVEGNYGPITEAAVNAWKRHCKFKPDSKFGRVAWKRLMNKKNDAHDRKAAK